MRAGVICVVGRLFAGGLTDVVYASKGEEEA
jgi:hypothetical protein